MKGLFSNLAFLHIGVIGSTAVIIITGSSVEAANVYVSSNTGEPWGSSDNRAAMNQAFGAGAWTQDYFQTANTASLFSGSNNFIFLEGSNGNADVLESFLTVNLPSIENWVSAGGTIFINAAPNQGDGMSYGFGGVTLNYLNFGNAVSAVNASHPIFNGPFATTTGFTGVSFSHATVTGGGITSLINDENGGSVLAELLYGSGIALFGGMTMTRFHNPNPQALNLRSNIIAYGASYNTTASTPEANSTPALLAVLIGLGVPVLRRRKTEARVEVSEEV